MTVSDAPRFVPGLALNTRFYWEIVRPIVLRVIGDAPHSAALMGYGSDVLGYDTPMSTDHNWGPRLQVFLGTDDFARCVGDLNAALRDELPPKFLGYSVHYSHPDPDDNNTQRMTTPTVGPVNHLLEICTVRGLHAAGISPSRRTNR